MTKFSDLELLGDKLSNTNSIRGALFALRDNFKAFGGCHIAYEFFLQESAYIRGDLINVTTLPNDTTRLYMPSGGTNSDPVIENISNLKEPLIIDLRKLCTAGNTKYYRNPFFIALMDMGCTSLAAYPIPLNGNAGYGALTIFETVAQRSSALDPAYYCIAGKRFHEAIYKLGHLARYFEISDKERYVLEQMANGKVAGDIALELGVTQRTVEQRLQNARKKLRARTTTEAVYKASVFAIIPV